MPFPHAVRAAGPSLPQVFRVWLSLGARSFGGGNATLALIRREIIDKRGWMTDAEFVRDWALCQVTPGINLLGLTTLIGRRLGGAAGIALALLGLLAPSVAITIALTAGYAHFQGLPAVRSALRGVIPATVGLGILTAAQMGRPLLSAARREGKSALLLACVLMGGAGTAVALGRLPVIAILCAAGAVGALANWARESARRRRLS